MPSLPERADTTPVAPTEGSSPRRVKAVFRKVRPGRPTPDPGLELLIKEVRTRRPKSAIRTVERAYEMAEVAHAGQIRKSGDPFITHPLQVATICAQLGLDETTVAAALR